MLWALNTEHCPVHCPLPEIGLYINKKKSTSLYTAMVWSTRRDCSVIIKELRFPFVNTSLYYTYNLYIGVKSGIMNSPLEFNFDCILGPCPLLVL